MWKLLKVMKIQKEDVTSMSSKKELGRGTFFFSQKQLDMSEASDKHTLCRLDSGEVVEYSEMISEENSDGSFTVGEGAHKHQVRPFCERFSDGVILGNGIHYGSK